MSTQTIETFRLRNSIAASLSILYLILVLRFGWLGDDAAITFRVVDNFLNGYGLRWNVLERVQSYTHPLWVALLIPVHWLSGEAFVSTIIFSALVSLSAFAIFLITLCDSIAVMVLGGGLWMLSVAIIDYSTSGLENCLEYLLIIVFIRTFFQSNSSVHRTRLMVIGGLVGLTRLDLLSLVLPAMVSRIDKTNVSIRSLGIGLAPLIAWEFFSLIYYGFPFPNTAYAKLGGGLLSQELCVQGGLYLIHHLWSDPTTLAVIFAAIVLPFAQKQRAMYPLVFGLILYLAYVISIGGDFMAGRMLAVPAVYAIALISKLQLTAHVPLASIAVVAALSALASKTQIDGTIVRSGGRPEWLPLSGVIDEREYYFSSTGLVNLNRLKEFPYHQHRDAGYAIRYGSDRVVVRGAVGIQGYFAGPDRHLIDIFGLGDPLLARLPAISTPYWRVGHLERVLPAGYVESIATEVNRLEDPGLRNYYNRLALIIRGDILDPQRLLEIVRMNLGYYDALIDEVSFRFPDLHTRTPEDFVTRVPDGLLWNSPGAVILTNRSRLKVEISPPRDMRLLHLAVDHNDRYLVRFYRGDTLVKMEKLVPPASYPSGLKNCLIQAELKEVSSIVITAMSVDDDASVGALRIE